MELTSEQVHWIVGGVLIAASILLILCPAEKRNGLPWIL